jgi:hypothetical protein
MKTAGFGRIFGLLLRSVGLHFAERITAVPVPRFRYIGVDITPNPVSRHRAVCPSSAI